MEIKIKNSFFSKTLFLFITVWLNFGLVYGQNNDPKAVQVLKKFNEQFSQSSGTFIDFSLTTYTKSKQLVAQKLMKLRLKGNLYNLQDKQIEIICDGKFIYNYDGQKTITKVALEDGDQSLNPQNIFAGNYEKDYQISYMNSTQPNFIEIKLTPNDKRINVAELVLSFNKATSLMNQATLTDKAGNKTIIKVNSFKLNQKFDNVFFTFDIKKYPKDAEIFD
ncbi:MAG: outer membrane lipoprotein carrier protein LolA [Sediminibacterium sp.]|nr:outer membrane lipoprotein carrier protein LolA [Sediminibacterium sp.]